MQTFRDKYMALPGDMSNAQSFWGVAHATPATCVTTASTTATTCNGNNDGSVVLSAGSNETYRFWQHLANAGLIEGSYSGITHGATTWSSTSANSPSSRIATALWFAYSWATMSANANVFDGVYGNALSVGGVVADQSPGGGIMTPGEMWAIDVKLDDGKPAIGRCVVRCLGPLSGCTTATGTTAAQAAMVSADYLLTSTTKNSSMMVRNAF